MLGDGRRLVIVRIRAVLRLAHRGVGVAGAFNSCLFCSFVCVCVFGRRLSSVGGPLFVAGGLGPWCALAGHMLCESSEGALELSGCSRSGVRMRVLDSLVQGCAVRWMPRGVTSLTALCVLPLLRRSRTALCETVRLAALL